MLLQERIKECSTLRGRAFFSCPLGYYQGEFTMYVHVRTDQFLNSLDDKCSWFLGSFPAVDQGRSRVEEKVGEQRACILHHEHLRAGRRGREGAGVALGDSRIACSQYIQYCNIACVYVIAKVFRLTIMAIMMILHNIIMTFKYHNMILLKHCPASTFKVTTFCDLHNSATGHYSYNHVSSISYTRE